MTDLELLITAAALRLAAEPDGGGRLADVPDGEVRAAIRYAQDAVEDVLGFNPIVHRVDHVVLYRSGPWSGPGGPYDKVYPTGRPVVEVFTAGVTTDGTALFPTPAASPYPPPTIQYAVGWRGEHHTLDGTENGEEPPVVENALRDLPGLDGANGGPELSVLPPLVPGAVRSVLVELAAVELDKRRLNLLGGRRNTTKISENSYTSEGYRKDAEAEILARLPVGLRTVSV